MRYWSLSKAVGGIGVAALLLVAVAATGALAGEPNPDYVFKMPGAEPGDPCTGEVIGSINDTATMPVRMDLLDTAVNAWSMSICDDALVSLPGVSAVADGADVATIHAGGPPQFHGKNVVAGSGWTVGAVVDFASVDQLLPGEDLEMYLVTYDIGPDTGVAAIEFCDGLANPPSPPTNNEVIFGEDSITPVFEQGAICIVDIVPFIFRLPTVSLEYRPDEGIASVTISATIEEDPDHVGFPNETIGFSMGVTHDPAVLDPTELVPTGALAALNDGKGPEFFGVNLDASGGGVTVGVAYIIFGDVTLAFAAETPVIDIAYAPQGLIDNEVGATSLLRFSDELGSPPVRNTVVVSETGESVLFVGGSVQFEPVLVPPFIRGDCKPDHALNLADVIFVLQYLFLEGQVPTCLAACDLTSDFQNNLADVIYLLNYLFLEGPVPGVPFPDCGEGPNPAQTNCESHPPCDD